VPQPSPRGALDVRSLPAGARVFVDGELVGSTPLVLRDVAPGEHAVRLDLPGFRPWVSRVDVAGGTTARVAGSLDR
jgi:hypothetical protein